MFQWASNLHEDAISARAERDLAPLRARLAQILSRPGAVDSAQAESVLNQMHDIYALVITAGVVAGWVSPFFPEVQSMPTGDAGRQPTPIDDRDLDLSMPVWPFLNSAVDWMQNTFTATPTRLADLVDAAQIEAAAFGNAVDERMISRLNTELQSSIKLGEGRNDWRKRLDGIMQTRSGFDETIGRTAHHQAFYMGQKDILRQPVIADIFPYRQYFCTVDGREREWHRALNDNVYHATSQLAAKAEGCLHEWNCRCSQIAMTEDDAILHGITRGGEPRGSAAMAASAVLEPMQLSLLRSLSLDSMGITFSG